MDASKQQAVEAARFKCEQICRWMRSEGYGLRWQSWGGGWFLQVRNPRGHVVAGPMRANKTRALMALCEAISGVQSKKKP